MNTPYDEDFEDWVLNCVGLPSLIKTQPSEALKAAFAAGRRAEKEAYDERANAERT